MVNILQRYYIFINYKNLLYFFIEILFVSNKFCTFAPKFKIILPME